eukprot:COSAG06_NODE_1424_length_9498_cov_12.066816_3_plen_253_part_00
MNSRRPGAQFSPCRRSRQTTSDCGLDTGRKPPRRVALMPCTQGRTVPGEGAASLPPQGTARLQHLLTHFPTGTAGAQDAIQTRFVHLGRQPPLPLPFCATRVCYATRLMSGQPKSTVSSTSRGSSRAKLRCCFAPPSSLRMAPLANRRRRTTPPGRCPQRRPPPAAPARDPPSPQPSVAAAAVDLAPAARQGDRTSADPGCFQPEGDRARLVRRQRAALWNAVPLRLRWPRALCEARTHTHIDMLNAQPKRS